MRKLKTIKFLDI